MIIGLTGSYCSGKDTIASYICKKHDYEHFSLSEVIREIMRKERIEPTRENLIIFGSKLREENGNEVLVKKVLEKISLGGKYCITSLRHSAEVNALRERKDFVLVNVDAPQHIRFERMQKRKRPGDPVTLERFIELEKEESQMSGHGQQLSKTANSADIMIINDLNDMATLECIIENLLKNIEKCSRYTI
ncbi:MAG: AAA family ATPase [Endomicrobium sp.]|jgi:dephospho-CoA kinase|nr:AAA family ATPase [Endomicrobium sp.]